MREIFQDDFWANLHDITLSMSPCTILEIGGGTGDGSTSAYADAFSKGSIVISTEVNPSRYPSLAAKPYVTTALFGSSVTTEEYMTLEQVIQFYKTTPTNLNQNSLETVIAWLNQGLSEIVGVPQGVIEGIKAEFVLIDGAPFSGEAEMRRTIDFANVLALDDINDIKNYTNYYQLLKDDKWELVWLNSLLRNGAAIFKRKSYQYS